MRRHTISIFCIITLSLCLASNLPAKEEGIKAATKDKSGEINRDGIYVEYKNGIVRDTKTGLEWIAGPDRDTNWNEAKSWVKTLDFDGGGWKMPSIGQLKTLYKKDADKRNKTPLLKTTGWWVWSRQIKHKNTSVRCYGFDFGHEGFLDPRDSGTMRAFAVRFRKKSTDDS